MFVLNDTVVHCAPAAHVLLARPDQVAGFQTRPPLMAEQLLFANLPPVQDLCQVGLGLNAGSCGHQRQVVGIANVG